jgi:hypothetical protein
LVKGGAGEVDLAVVLDRMNIAIGETLGELFYVRAFSVKLY